MRWLGRVFTVVALAVGLFLNVGPTSAQVPPRSSTDPTAPASAGPLGAQVGARPAPDPKAQSGPSREPVRAAVVASQTISSGGPLTQITIGAEGSAQISHAGDSTFEWYPYFISPGDSGTILLVGNTLFAPDFRGHGASGTVSLFNRGYTVFTPVSQSPVSGLGTAASPFQVQTVYDAGSTVRITQTDSYVVGQELYLTDIQLADRSGAPQSVTLYRAGDCYLGGSDVGFGLVGPEPGAVACTKTANNQPPDRIEQLVPLSAGASYLETYYDTLWNLIGAKAPLPNTCDCTISEDNAIGISWAFTLPASGQVTRSHITAFSPVGNFPLSLAKTADASTSPAGGANGYTITVTNPNPVPVILDSLTDTLPAGFSYLPGSSTGLTSGNPSITGQSLTWAGPMTVPAGTAALHFGVTVATSPGTYFNNASASAAGGFSIAPTGNTAPITVQGTVLTSTPAVSPTVTRTPAPGTGAGGRSFRLTSGVGGTGACTPSGCSGVLLDWLPGLTQSGYAVARLAGGSLSFLPTTGPLAADVTSFTDGPPPAGLDCYALFPLGLSPQPTSDLLCLFVTPHSTANAPRNLSISLNESTTAHLAWLPPFGGYDSFLVQFLGGASQTLPAGVTSIDLLFSGPTCVVVGTMLNGVLQGTSDPVCAIPGFAQGLGPAALTSTPTATLTAVPTSTPSRTPTATAAPPTATATRTATSTATTQPTGCPAVGSLPLGPKMYVALKGSSCIAIYDPSTGTQLGRIPVSGGPDGLALSPNGTRLYATNTDGNRVTVIDTATNAAVATFPLTAGPYGVDVNGTGTRVYTANPTQLQCAGGPGSVSIIDGTTNSVITNVTTTVVAPLDVAVNPAGTRVYVGGGCQDIDVIDTSTNSTLPSLDTGPIGFGVGKLAVSPDGTRLYAPIYGIAGTDKTEVQVFDTATGTRVSTITVGTRPFAVTMHPTLPRAYVENILSNTVSVIDTTSNTVIATVNVGTSPYESAVYQPGNRLYVSNTPDGTLSVVDTTTNTAVGTIQTGSGSQPLDIVIFSPPSG